ncbi:MAG: sulfotransferase [Gammaproteobacteria bacterium]|nr:sulfotransferase [Gammaproteobacteria bacterium]
MAFSFRNLFRFTWRWLASIRWTPRRALIVIAYFVVVPLLELVTSACLLLDRFLFSRYRTRTITEPVFIIGNFRSGTTFLHRLLAGDRNRFSTMKMWEILFAPSVTQRRMVGAFAALDRKLGNPVPRLLRWIESYWHDANVMHEVSLTQPEEDEYLCLHIWSALTIGLSSGLLDEARPHAWFDHDLPAEDRKRIMSFYADCVRRHLVDRDAGHNLQYLAKNPALTPKIGSTLEQFPDAKIIYLVRNPLEAIPSFVSMMKFSWEVMGAGTEDSALADFVTEMAGHWYRYPLERLAQAPADSYRIIVYDDLVSDPAAVVRGIYAHFQYAIDADFEQVLTGVAGEARSYRSRHEYDLESLGLDRARLTEEFADVIDRFGFEC